MREELSANCQAHYLLARAAALEFSYVWALRSLLPHVLRAVRRCSYQAMGREEL